MPTLAISISAQGTNTTTYTFSGPDAQRYFNAWKTRIGPKDPVTGDPIGTQKQMTTWCADQVMVALDHLITTTEQQAVVPPDKTSAES